MGGGAHDKILAASGAVTHHPPRVCPAAQQQPRPPTYHAPVVAHMARQPHLQQGDGRQL